jgi:hypothetical protein
MASFSLVTDVTNSSSNTCLVWFLICFVSKTPAEPADFFFCHKKMMTVYLEKKISVKKNLVFFFKKKKAKRSALDAGFPTHPVSSRLGHYWPSKVFKWALFFVFFRFRAVFATKTFLIWARFSRFLVQHHHKFSALPEYRVKIKKKNAKKGVEHRFAPLYFFSRPHSRVTYTVIIFFGDLFFLHGHQFFLKKHDFL